VKPIELTEISWYVEDRELVVIDLSENITISLTLEEFSYLLHDLNETKSALLEIGDIKIGTADHDGEIIEELVVVTEDEEYN
tara:strand:- start:881 stop:1126 length:246 start_codon:yes stop_codon:yes gene_type:complete